MMKVKKFSYKALQFFVNISSDNLFIISLLLYPYLKQNILFYFYQIILSYVLNNSFPCPAQKGMIGLEPVEKMEKAAKSGT